MPRIFSNIGMNYSTPFCYLNDTEAEQCALNIGKNIVAEQNTSSNCKKSCSNLIYSGEISGIMPFSQQNKTGNSYIFSYILTNNEFMSNIFEEYLIYDFIGMIGSVGGTLGKFLSKINSFILWLFKASFCNLGMFIGFSVTGAISWFLAHFKNP